VQGQAVRFSARVEADAASASTPTGPVQFLVDEQPFGEPVAARRGVAVSLPARALALGGHEVVARFLGSSGYAASTGITTQQITLAPPPGDTSAAEGPVQAPRPRLSVLSKRARVDADGTLGLQVRCSGEPGRRCVGTLALRTTRAVPRRLSADARRQRARVTVATRRISLAAGSHTRLKLDLDQAGARLLSRIRGRHLRVGARMSGTRGGAGSLRLVRSSAPAIAIDRRGARLGPAGRLTLRLSCPAPWRRWCEGELTLAGPRGRLDRRPLLLAGGEGQPFHLTLGSAAREEVRRAGRVRVRTRSLIPAGRATVRKRMLGVSSG
jgi:hypothetical protein